MNTFNYWFNYIVRNGKFVENTYGNDWKIYCNKFKKNERYEYTAFYIPNSDNVIEATMGILCQCSPLSSNVSYYRMFVQKNFDPNHSSLKPLLSMRKII